MTKTLYLMRHGQTLFNEQHRIQGWSDSPLTQKGIDDAKLVGDYFQKENIKFDHAYSSTQERASDTLELVTKQPYERLKGLKEWNFGEFEAESERLNPEDDPKRHSYGDFFLQYGGESDQEVQDRMVKTLTEVMERPDNQRVLAVSHGGACFMFLRKWLAIDEIKKKVSFHNCCILKFEYNDGEFKYIDSLNLSDK
ncbi:histidine phosphatase family protein [Companilactobacillus hulinensis]|uniref:histidine phosphatase family protein n=1 Tax=Companilactobacillus hulinensis TaxID=2486007 RepID=UPI000F775F36|nr:histidine phosphatase family protein [Companilactobacillus hulinensis]